METAESRALKVWDRPWVNDLYLFNYELGLDDAFQLVANMHGQPFIRSTLFWKNREGFVKEIVYEPEK